MANVTLTIAEDVLKRARIRALDQGTSVNAVIRDFLERYAGSERERDALRAFSELADRTSARSGPEGRSWTRDDLYD